MKKTLLILSIIISLSLGVFYYFQNRYDNIYVSERSGLVDSYKKMDISINGYDLYNAECSATTGVTGSTVYFKDYFRNYTYHMNDNCPNDPFFYILIDNQYLTLNEAVDKRYITIKQVKESFIDTYEGFKVNIDIQVDE